MEKIIRDIDFWLHARLSHMSNREKQLFFDNYILRWYDGTLYTSENCPKIC